MQFSHLGITEVKLVSNAQALTDGVTAYSTAMKLRVWAGFAALEVVANSVTVVITQQCSTDNINWYDPVDKSGAALGAIASALATTGYIEFDPVLALYVRLKYVPTGSGAITCKLILSE